MEYRLVMICWLDSFGCSPDWRELGDASDCNPPVCYSVGWLVVDGEKIKTVVPHIHGNNEEIGAVESGCGDMSIPVAAIISMDDLQ